MAQKWGFAEIYGGVSDIQGAVGTTHALLDEGKGTMTRLQAAWHGDAQTEWGVLQTRWDATSHELNEALKNLAQKVQEGAEHMEHTEKMVQGSFQGG